MRVSGILLVTNLSISSPNSWMGTLWKFCECSEKMALIAIVQRTANRGRRARINRHCGVYDGGGALSVFNRTLSTLPPNKSKSPSVAARLSAAASFPDFIEHWNREMFYKAGGVMTAAGVALTAGLGICQETMIYDAIVAAYWIKGYQDINQKSHAILKNFPVLGNARYLMEGEYRGEHWLPLAALAFFWPRAATAPFDAD